MAKNSTSEDFAAFGKTYFLQKKSMLYENLKLIKQKHFFVLIFFLDKSVHICLLRENLLLYTSLVTKSITGSPHLVRFHLVRSPV